MTPAKTRSAWIFPTLIAATYFLSRMFFYFIGIRFDASGLDWYWQYLDVELLKTDLLRSVFYQHSQPPLFNLFLGSVLKWFPNSYEAVFAVLYKALSLSLYYMLFRILTLLRFKPWVAFLAATLFMLSPTSVLYENWLFYTWPTAVALTFAAHRLLLFEQHRSPRDGLLYIAVLTAVCLARSMFHPIYLIAAFIPVVWMRSAVRKQLGAAAGIALCLIAAVFLKNLLLFGVFGSSSWMGMNLWKIAPVGGKSAQLADSAVAHIEPFSPIDDYSASFRTVPESYSAIPAVAAELKRSGYPNLNHYGYLAVSDAYQLEALELIQQDPGGYLSIVLKAWGIYISPASGYPLLDPSNLNTLRKYSRLTTPITSGLLISGALILTAFFFFNSIAPRSRIRPFLQERAFLSFCIGTVFYVAILGNFMEHGENMRFRVQTDPLLYVASLISLIHLFRFFTKRQDLLTKENREMD